MNVALACDHGGFKLKEAVREYLDGKGVPYEDFGTYSTESVDYPLFAVKAARCVAEGRADCGIFLCTTGIGISMAANKVKGIRAAVCTDTHCAEMTRRHNNANVLCMGEQVVDKETALQIVEVFLNTAFDGGKHARRVGQIAQIEEGKL